MTIEYWRTEIDEVDRELLRLLNRRVRLAIKVGTLKRAEGLPCCDPERERDVLTTLQQANTGPLDSRAVGKIFRRVIEESRRVEMQIPHEQQSIGEALNEQLLNAVRRNRSEAEGTGPREALL